MISLWFVFLFSSSFTYAENIKFTSDWKIFPETKTGEVPAIPPEALTSKQARSVMAAEFQSGFKNKAGKILNPYLGSGLLEWPGAPDSLRGRFDKQNMPEGSPYAKPWWYGRRFVLKKPAKNERIWLDLARINYTAELYVNGKKVPTDLIGPYRLHKIDITDFVVPRENTLLFRVQAAGIDNLGYTWLDWNPHPSDKMLGILEDPKITLGSAVRIHSPYVRSIVSSDKNKADLSLDFSLLNSLPTEVSGKVTVQYRGGAKSKNVTLPPAKSPAEPSRLTVHLDSEEFRSLQVSHPHLWWPRNMGDAHLEKMQIRFEGKGVRSANLPFQFGIRQIQGWLEGTIRKFSINHRPLVIRGVGWAPDFLMDETPEKKQEKLRYVIDMGYNAIRHEGTMELDDFYNVTDREGILVLAGWPCCTQWEADETGRAWDQWKEWLWTDKKYQVAAESLRDQLEMLRSHSSFLAWFNGSDLPPHQSLEKLYRVLYESLLMDKGLVIPRAADDNESRHSQEFGRSGVRMDGPYDHVMAGYWYDPKIKGFHSELGPGISIATRESLLDLAPNAQWPLFKSCAEGETLNQNLLNHSGTLVFQGLKFFYSDLCTRYGEPKDLDDFLRKTQLLNYEDLRAMNEAFRRKAQHGSTTGHVHWMGMNAWPSARWNLFDYYLRQGGSYFGAKEAQRPIHIQYSYDDQTVWIFNEEPKNYPKLTLTVKAYSPDSQVMFQYTLKEVKISSSKNLAQGEAIAVLGKELEKAFAALPKENDTLILSMRLLVGKKLLDAQTYWVSRTKDELNPVVKPDWFRASAKKSATYLSLGKAFGNDPVIKQKAASNNKIHVTLSNNSKDKLSFFHRLTVRDKKTKREIWPQLWNDNFISLEPKEIRELTLELPGGIRARDAEVSLVF